MADDAATQAQIDAAWSGLLNVIHYLDFQAGDASALEELYNLLSGLVEDDFNEQQLGGICRRNGAGSGSPCRG